MTIAERFRAMPRAARWGLLAAAGIAAYFGVVEPILDARTRLMVQADDKAKRLLEVRTGSEAATLAEGELKVGIAHNGLPELPGDPKKRSEALTNRIATVLQARGVHDHTSTVKETPLATGPLTAAVGADSRVDRLIHELQFECSPETFFGVLADLERAPEVAAVSRVQLRKSTPPPGSRGSPPRLVKANIAVEAWELVPKGRAR